MTQDDVLFSYRLQLFELAGRTTVANACRVFGVHRSTYYRWKHAVDRQGLEMLRPRERRRPVMPNQMPMIIEERIVGFSLGHPGLGPKRISAQLRRAEWGGLIVSANGVWKVLVRHGINTRAKRLALIAGYRAPYQPPEEPTPEPHIDVQRPGELVGIDCFFVGRLRDTKGSVWQLTAIDCYSSYAWAELVRCRRAKSARPRPRAWWSEWRASSSKPAGNSSACSATTAASSGSSRSATRSRSSRRITAAFTLDARRPTVMSSACTERFSKSAGDLPLRATYICAIAACSANSTPTCASTTTSVPTPDGSPRERSQPTSSTVRGRWS